VLLRGEGAGFCAGSDVKEMAGASMEERLRIAERKAVLMRSLAELDVTIDGETSRCSFALASRIRKYGGEIIVAPGAHLLRDDFEVVLFEGATSFRYLRYLLGVARGRLHRTAGVTIRRAHSVHLSCPEDTRVRLQLDGDYAGRLPATIEIVPDALTLLVPESFRLES